MPIPLADSIAAALSDRTTALAAAFIIGTHHADVLQWVARTIGAAGLEPQLHLHPKPNGGGRVARAGRAPRRARSNGHRELRGDGVAYSDRRRATRDEADSKLLEAMRDAPGATIGDWAHAVGRSKSSTVSDLHRLKSAGLVANEDRAWALVDEPAPKDPSAKWVAPLRGRDRAAVAHLNAAG